MNVLTGHGGDQTQEGEKPDTGESATLRVQFTK